MSTGDLGVVSKPNAAAALQTALEDAGFRHFPWIETGSVKS